MQNLPGRHAREDELERYSLDFLPSTEAEILREHIVSCEHCRARLSVFAAEARALRAASAAVWHDPPKTWMNRLRELAQACAPCTPAFAWKLAFAAGVFLVCTVVLPRPWEAAGPPLTLVLQTTRGSVSMGAQAPAGRQLRLEPDMTGISPEGPLGIELVNGSGEPVTVSKRAATLLVKRRLPPGQYVIRLYGGPDLLREYGLRIVEQTR